jgi:hypothetical protein
MHTQMDRHESPTPIYLIQLSARLPKTCVSVFIIRVVFEYAVIFQVYVIIIFALFCSK